MIPVAWMIVPVCLTVLDSVLVITIAILLLRRIRKTGDDLTATASVSVSNAADDVKQVLLPLLGQFLSGMQHTEPVTEDEIPLKAVK